MKWLMLVYSRIGRLDTYFCVNRIGSDVHKLQCWASKLNFKDGELLWCLELCWWELECCGEGNDSPRGGQWSSGRLGIHLDHLSPGLTAWHLNCILFLILSLRVSALLWCSCTASLSHLIYLCFIRITLEGINPDHCALLCCPLYSQVPKVPIAQIS